MGNEEQAALERDIEVIRHVAAGLGVPGLEEGIAWGTFALKVRGKMVIRWRESGVAVVRCSIHTKKMLIASKPDQFYETEHYRKYPAILVRLSVADVGDLEQLIEDAWREFASKQQISKWDTSGKGGAREAK